MSGPEASWRPLLASGRLVGDYTPLRIYQEVAREMGRDPGAVVITTQDVLYVERLAREAGIGDLEAILSVLRSSIAGRIDPEVASEAYRRYLGTDVGAEASIRMISDLVARWCVEAAELMGFLRIRGL